MEVGMIVRETIMFKRALQCEHVWAPYEGAEDQCQNCGVIATAEGKANLARLAAQARRP